MRLTKDRYNKISLWLTARPHLLTLVKVLNRGLPAVFYAAYPLLLALLVIRRDPRFPGVLAIPAAVFVLVSVLRVCLNWQRPYEKLDITPLIGREGTGRSFPSRHASSAAVIAVVFCFVWPPAGAVLSPVALLIAAVRVLAGHHFPRDVAAGLLLGLVLGIAGFLLI